jgi:putative glutathione S-transferase
MADQKKEKVTPKHALNSINKRGDYEREASAHRHLIEPGTRFEPEVGRYHLHVALACPWACGTLSMLKLQGLEDIISYSQVHPTWNRTKPDDDEDKHTGWVYRSPGDPPLTNSLGYGSIAVDEACKPDTFTNAQTIRELYEICGDTKGPFSTPVLWDKKTRTIVNNESTDILRILNSAFGAFAKTPQNLYPAALEADLSTLNKELVYANVNNGVYRCGFARSQDSYDLAVEQLFLALDELEAHLGKQRFLGGGQFTWLDLRLFHTLVRFDPVYTCYFKTNVRRIADYPNLLGFVRDVYSIEAIAATINMAHIKAHYFTSHPQLNTFAIIPKSNGPDLTLPHGRESLSSAEPTDV